MTKEFSTSGMIIKETKVGEGNKIFTILTLDYGKIQASGAGVRSYKSKISSGCSLFTYSDFIFRQGKSKNIYNIVSAEKKVDFYELRYDLKALALENYLCDISNTVTVSDGDCREILRLLLNTLYYVKKEGYSPKVKPVFEFRLLSEAGFKPNLYSCEKCGSADNLLYFSPDFFGVECTGCKRETNISAGTLEAMRYASSAPLKNLFNFKINEKILNEFTNFAEQCILHNIGRMPKSLTYLKSL